MKYFTLANLLGSRSAQQCGRERERPGEHHLKAWLAQATASGIQDLSGFARGVADDQAPVEAALSLEWRDGQTEGLVNKLKLPKRRMYGRASFEFLRRRYLLTA